MDDQRDCAEEAANRVEMHAEAEAAQVKAAMAERLEVEVGYDTVASKFEQFDVELHEYDDELISRGGIYPVEIWMGDNEMEVQFGFPPEAWPTIKGRIDVVYAEWEAKMHERNKGAADVG